MTFELNQYWKVSGGLWNVVVATDGYRCRCQFHTVDEFGNLVPVKRMLRGDNGLLNQNKTKVH